MGRADGQLPHLSLTRGDILYSSWSRPNFDWIYYKDLDGRKRFSMGFLSSCLAFLETVVLHERIVVGLADTAAPLKKGDTKSEAYDILNSLYAPNWISQVKLGADEIFERLQKEGILHALEARLSDLTAFELADFYAATPSVVEKKQRLDELGRAFETDEDRVGRIVLDRISRDVGIPLLLTEVASRASIPLRVSIPEANELSQITNVDRCIQSGVIEHLKKKLDTGALREIERLEELGHTTIFPRTAIATQIVSESEKAEDMLDVTLSLRKQYSDFRQQMAELENEIFDPDLTLSRKRKMVRGLDDAANELWPVKTSQFQQVTSEISAVSNLALASVNPLNFKYIPDSVLAIVGQPWELIRRHLRRRKVRAMLETKRAFLNSRPTVEMISRMFGCPTPVIRRSIIEERAYQKTY